jgi:hypothetical protein
MGKYTTFPSTKMKAKNWIIVQAGALGNPRHEG